MATITELPKIESFPLGDGTKSSIPTFGFGTCGAATATQSALYALQSGYRHLDTAQIYFNEAETGAAIAQSKVPREQLFICSKLWEDMYGREAALRGVEQSLQKLGCGYIDLYLLHTPRPGPKARLESWLGLQEAVEKGWVKSIGVSNWAPRHVEELVAHPDVKIKPVVNQIEFHPWQQQRELRKYCAEKGIVVVAYSPIAQGKRLGDEAVKKLAAKYGRSPAQVVLRWVLQKGVVAIPKSDREMRITENLGALGWEMEKEDVEALDALDEGQKGNQGEWDPYAWE